MTEVEFYLKEVATWGVEYIESLLDRGYTIVPSDKASNTWAWQAPVANMGYTRNPIPADSWGLTTA
jgi:hypothetical protein